MPDLSSSRTAYLTGFDTGVSKNSAYLAGTNVRTTRVSTQVEYRFTYNKRRTSAIYLQVEYSPLTASHATSGYLYGVVGANSNQPVYLAGQAEAPGQQSAYAEGTLPQGSSSTPVFLTAHDSSSSGSPGYLQGVSSLAASQLAYLSGSSELAVSLLAYLEGFDAGVSDNPAYLAGEVAGQASLPAFLSAVATQSEKQSSFLAGATGQPAIAWAELETPAPIYSASGSLPAFLAGSIDGNAAQPAYLFGVVAKISSLPVYLSGNDTASSNQPAYCRGGEASSASLPAYLTANILTTGEQPAYLEGYSEGEFSSLAAYLLGSSDGKASVPAFLQSGVVKASQGAFLAGGTGTFPIQVGDAWSQYYGSALLTNSFGVKYAVTKASSTHTILIYRDINGAPKLVASQSAATVGNNSQWIDARIDGNDCIHIISHGGTPSATLDIAYRVFDTRNDTWIGSWEQAATLYAEIFDNWSIRIAIDSNNKPHVVYVDPVTGTYPNIKYIEKTGANWSSPVTLSEHASDSYRVWGITMLDGDDIDVFCFDDTLNDALYIQKVDGNWGSETVWVGSFMELLSGVFQVVDGNGNIYRYHAADIGTYALLYENNVSTGVQVADLDPWFSACILSSMPSIRCIVYRNDSGAIWLATYDGSWSSRIINSATGIGGWTEWAYNFENEQSLVGYIYTLASKLYYDEVTPIVYSSKHAYTEGYQPKSSVHAYLSGWAHPTSSAHAYMFCGTADKSSTSAFTNGAATQSSLHAYLEGLEYSSPLPAYLYGGIGSDTPACLQGIVVLTGVESAYTSGWSHVLDSGPAFLFGNIAPSSGQAAFTQGISSTPWNFHAFLQGIEANHLPAYLEGMAVPRDYVRVRNGEQVFQFKVLSEGFSDGELLPSISLARTIPGGLDISAGGKYRQWRPMLRLAYNDIANLEALYASGEIWTYEDHFGMEHNVVLVGSWQKSLISTTVEGGNSLFFVRVTFVEVLT